MTDHNIGYQLVKRYRLGLVNKPLPGDEQFYGMLTIPYMTRNGIRAMKFRNLRYDGVNGIKFHAITGQKPRLYNTNVYYVAHDVVGLTEGEIDAINATEYLKLPTMGIPGAEMWHKMEAIWGKVFKDYRAVVMFSDGDRAGRDLAKDVSETLSAWKLRIIECPDGMDTASMIRMGRASELISKWQLATKEEQDDED